MAGLLAARVLSDHFDGVTLLDRDRLPDGPEPRTGVPQGRHLHLLLGRGAELLERFFPGLLVELAAAGATTVELPAEALLMTRAGWVRRFRTGRTTTCLS